MIIDNEVRILFDDLTFQGIIWHHGNNANCGHYSSSVIVDDRWFSISDTDVREGQRIHFNMNDNSTVPYILVYKKRNLAQNLFLVLCMTLEGPKTAITKKLNRGVII